jgi:hypothetical protein
MKTCTFNPKTHKVVPIESNDRMDYWGEDALANSITGDEAIYCWDAMISASPEYPADAVKPCIDELIASVKALVACKGRFHTQQNFERLALAYKNFEVGNSPALPPSPEGV